MIMMLRRWALLCWEEMNVKEYLQNNDSTDMFVLFNNSASLFVLQVAHVTYLLVWFQHLFWVNQLFPFKIIISSGDTSLQGFLVIWMHHHQICFPPSLQFSKIFLQASPTEYICHAARHITHTLTITLRNHCSTSYSEAPLSEIRTEN